VAVARSSKAEAAIAVTTAAFVITIGVLQAIIVAVVLSVADIIRRAARPTDAVLGWSVKDDRYVDVSDHPDAGITSGVVVYRIQDLLFFANATSSNAGLRRYPAWMPCSGSGRWRFRSRLATSVPAVRPLLAAAAVPRSSGWTGSSS
jgi:MFS superfamily sulfate permease-like transporter